MAAESRWWKRVLDVQRPYRWNLRRLRPGRTLDVGCGLGRNLGHLAGDGVGVDHNADMVAHCRSRGFEAYLAGELPPPDAWPEPFDTLLLSHVVEHLADGEAETLVEQYLPYLRDGGRVIIITPQEAGYRSDPTHLTFVDFDASRTLANRVGCTVERSFSFPFPRAAGRVFRYNEFVTVAVRDRG